jgi:uncharacterized membrane protein YhaH (DUF805 family)
MNWIGQALKKSVTFSGRSQRAEYWYFVLFYLTGYGALAVADHWIGTWSRAADIGLLSGVFVFTMFLPFLAVSVRRLHDIGKSGWWNLIGFIPYAGAIALNLFLAIDGDSAPNQYGANPKGKVNLA